MIIKDVNQHGVVKPNNIDGHYLICDFLVNPFIFCFRLILLQPEHNSYFPGRNRIFLHFPGGAGALSLLECVKN